VAQLNPTAAPHLVLLVNAEDALALVATTNPPRLFARSDARGKDLRRELRGISDQEAGQLVVENPSWTCPDIPAAVTYLIDSWCARRCLGPLAGIPRASPINGLTDGAHELLDALRNARFVARDQATDFEFELLTAAESALAQRLSPR
jgi:hypothetical protein